MTDQHHAAPTPVPTKPAGPRLRDAMPRPLLVVFVLAGVVSLVATLVVLIRPPTFDSVALADRRPPPQDPYTHDAREVGPAPLPVGTKPISVACAGGSVEVLAGPAGQFRLRQTLQVMCGYTGGVAEELATAVRALDGVRLQYGIFERTGAESTLDRATKTLWINAKFASTKLEFTHVIPVIAHDAYHLAHTGDAVDAHAELAARRAEIAACRQAIPIDDWPRWCNDARVLTELPEDRALMLLAQSGFVR